MTTEHQRLDRLKRRLPHNWKNPRKTKKAWKKEMQKRLNRFHGPMARFIRLHWVPGEGWTMTLKPRAWSSTK